MSQNNSNIKYPEVKVRDVARYMWIVVRNFRFQIVITSILIVMASACEIIEPIYYKKLIDIAFAGNLKSDLPAIISAIKMILAFNLIAWTGWRLSAFLNGMMEPRIVTDLSRQAYNYLIYHSHTFFTNNFSGSLVQRIKRYSRAFEVIDERVLWTVLPVLTQIVGVIYVTYSVNRYITLLILVWTTLFVAVAAIYGKYRTKFNLRQAELDSKVTGFLSDTIANQNTIDAFSKHKREIDGYREVSEQSTKMIIQNYQSINVMDGLQMLFLFAIEFGAMYFVAIMWSQGKATPGTFVLLQMYVVGLGNKIWNFSRIVRDAYQTFSDSKEMVEIMMLPHDVRDTPNAKKLVVTEGGIEMQGLGYAFNETRDVIKNINLSVNPGEKTAIVGPSGAGKTTLIRLLLRYYNPTSGHILIDGNDIQHCTLKSLRENISLVPQDPLLFHRSLKDNIRYARPNASDGEVIRAAKLAHCHEFITNLQNGYETLVGERGIKLSGGERQRVAIARAILKDAPILILDEATSSLDSQSESYIQDALSTLMKNKTVIVIAHRLSTIRQMDRIIVLKHGDIIEDGTHEELLAKNNSLYKDLWSLQSGGFIS